MMYYVEVTLGVLLAEAAFVAAMTGILYIYWNAVTKNKADA